MIDDEIPENPLTSIEKELQSPARQRKQHPSHTETHPLDARKEKGRNIQRGKRHLTGKVKKYDGRAFSKNAIASRSQVREALDSFYKEVKLPELKQALEVSNDPRYNMLLAAINNPRFNSCSFAELCRKCRMSIQDVVEVWRNHLKTQGIVKMMGHMPEIMEDVAVDSKSKVVVCDMCQGEGRLHDKKVNNIEDPICPECHGDGKVRLLGDKDARLLAFETVGLKKGGGILVGVNIDNRKGGVPAMEDQISNVEKIFDAEYENITEKEISSEQTGNGNNHGDAPTTGAATSTSGQLGGEHGKVEDSAGGLDPDDLDEPSDPTDYSA